MSVKHSRRKTRFEIAYERYMNSEEWRTKRKQRLEIDRHQCQYPKECGGICGDSGSKTNYLEVHHIRYPKKLGTEGMSDLITLCKQHHEITHHFLKQQRSI